MSRTAMKMLRDFAKTDTFEAALRELLEAINDEGPSPERPDALKGVSCHDGEIAYSYRLVGAMERARTLLSIEERRGTERCDCGRVRNPGTCPGHCDNDE